jgi:TRAP-type mannitol/chloroaromatic compound transport system permease small subunit
MKKVLKAIGGINEYTGRITGALVVILVIILCYEVTVRYVFGRPTLWAHIVSRMLYGSVCLLALGYAELYDSHIRCDVLYARFPKRTKAIIDLIGAVVFTFPLLYAYLKTSAQWAVIAWVEKEVRRSEAYIYPPAGPFRTVVFIGFLFFLLQSLVTFYKNFVIAAEADAPASQPRGKK